MTAPEIQYLLNTLYCLRTKKNLILGYLGGSVTNGVGASDMESTSWRAITRDWLKVSFSDASISEINASIGGIGSAFAMYRVDEHLIKNKAPDLVFIELAANDALDFVDGERVYGSNDCYINIETIVRKIYSSNPQSDIVFVLTGNYERLKTESDGGEQFGYQYIDIAKHYDIPVIRVGTALAERMKSENDGVFPPKTGNTYPELWQKYANSATDNVHPNDMGYRVYADTVIEWLKHELANGYAPTAAVKKVIPVTAYCDLFGKGKLCLDATIAAPNKLAGEINGFSLIENTGNRLSAYSLVSACEGSTVELSFNSGAIGLWLVIRSEDARPGIKYSVDGQEEIPVPDKWFEGGNQPNKICMLAKSLQRGIMHTVRITHTDCNMFDCRQILLCDFGAEECEVKIKQ